MLSQKITGVFNQQDFHFEFLLLTQNFYNFVSAVLYIDLRRRIIDAFYLVKENEDVVGTASSIYPLNLENHVECSQEEYVQNGGFIVQPSKSDESISDTEKILDVLML